MQISHHYCPFTVFLLRLWWWLFTWKQIPRQPLHGYINGPIERKGGYQAEEGEKTEVRRRTVRVGDGGGNCARREEKKEGGRGRLQKWAADRGWCWRGGGAGVEADSTHRWRMKENEKERLIVDGGAVHKWRESNMHVGVEEREAHPHSGFISVCLWKTGRSELSSPSSPC